MEAAHPLRALGLPQGHSLHIPLAKAVTGQARLKEWGIRLHLLKEPTLQSVWVQGGSGSSEAIVTTVYHSNTGHSLGFDI